MKALCILFISFLTLSGAMPNKTVSYVDSKRFGGTWYSLYSIPTMFDKGSRETTAHYTLNKDGYYDVVTTCIKNEKGDLRSVKSKLFRVDGTIDGQMKAQFLWPFKVDYWVIDLAPDYSWVVIGHPEHKFLFIMSRKPEMDPRLHEEIVAKCKAMGYATEQAHLAAIPRRKITHRITLQPNHTLKNNITIYTKANILKSYLFRMTAFVIIFLLRKEEMMVGVLRGWM